MSQVEGVKLNDGGIKISNTMANDNQSGKKLGEIVAASQTESLLRGNIPSHQSNSATSQNLEIEELQTIDDNSQISSSELMEQQKAQLESFGIDFDDIKSRETKDGKIEYTLNNGEKYTLTQLENGLYHLETKEYFNSEGVIQTRQEFDENNNKIKTYHYTDGKKTGLNTFDENGTITATYYYDENGAEYTNQFVYEYDENGNHYQTIAKDLRQGTSSVTTFYENEKVASVTTYSENNIPTGTTEYSQEGARVGEIKYDEAGNAITTYNWNYDTHQVTIKDLTTGDYEIQQYNESGTRKMQIEYYNKAGELIDTKRLNPMENMPYYCQGLNGGSEWSNLVITPGQNDHISDSGCGYCSMAMIMSFLTGKEITPQYLLDDPEYLLRNSDGVNRIRTNEFDVPHGGMSSEMPKFIANAYGYKTSEKLGKNDWAEVQAALENGYPVLCSQGPGKFTSNGHIITLTGVDANSGTVYVNDPGDWRATAGQNEPCTINEVNDTASYYYIFYS